MRTTSTSLQQTETHLYGSARLGIKTAPIDPKTGKAKTRVSSKTVTANVYSGDIWNEETKKFEGVNKVNALKEEWKYDSNGNRIEEKKAINREDIAKKD